MTESTGGRPSRRTASRSRTAGAVLILGAAFALTLAGVTLAGPDASSGGAPGSPVSSRPTAAVPIAAVPTAPAAMPGAGGGPIGLATRAPTPDPTPEPSCPPASEPLATADT